MSEDETYIIDSEDTESANGSDGGAFGEEEEIAPVDQSPSEIYESAKSNINFQDVDAYNMFVGLLEREDIDEKLKSKAYYYSAMLSPILNDMDNTISLFQTVVEISNDGKLKYKHLQNCINDIINRLFGNDENVRQFLNFACDIVSSGLYPNLSLDLKLRRIENELKFANYPLVKQYLVDAEQGIPANIDQGDSEMCRSALRVYIIRIELAQIDGDSNQVMNFYRKTQAIKSTNMSNRQTAVLRHVEGESLLRSRQFAQSRTVLFDSFKLFSDCGSNKRTEVLPYWVLSTMLIHDTIDVFMSKDVSVFQNHPLVAPIRQLYSFYMNNDIVGFKNKKSEALKTFHNEPFYENLINEIQEYVYSNSLIIFCRKYSSVQIVFINENTKTEAEKAHLASLKQEEQNSIIYQEVEKIKKRLIMLIINGRLDATINDDLDIVNLYTKKESPFLPSIIPMISALEASFKARIN